MSTAACLGKLPFVLVNLSSQAGVHPLCLVILTLFSSVSHQADRSIASAAITLREYAAIN
ncbi:hypothetical protein [Paraburkholderia pallida]|uniref:Uncharacterized protein n=1 Tax=Paraburkholderia pallida TaxID=2547399 RepID=A0A4P7CX31_9BURK|nr:hypothetical protein [Paraburkholderia pallida]QBQ98711.1 hypothetical protein E1956_15635 [Paraburkholderia pallida]